MNRQLKFRVWDKLAERMIYPHNDNQQHFIIDLNGRFHNLQNGSGGDDYVIQQYTGLNDSKGKEIYEGDIVKEHHFEDWGDEIGYEYIGIVVYKMCSDGILFAGYKTIAAKNQNTKFSGNAIQSDCEVIGNIFEHAELLK